MNKKLVFKAKEKLRAERSKLCDKVKADAEMLIAYSNKVGEYCAIQRLVDSTKKYAKHTETYNI